MKKQFIVIGIIVLFLTGGLNGCLESKTDYKPLTSGDTDKVELLNCTIETYGAMNSSQRIKLGDGFIHGSTYNVTYYDIKGTIKNIAHYILHEIKITVNFYDENNSYLANTSALVYGLRRNFTKNFTTVYINQYPFFDNITQVVIDIRID